MSSIDLGNVLPHFPIGTVINAYPGVINDAGWPRPAGSVVGTGTVSEAGTLTITGLPEEDGEYVAAAKISGSWVFRYFTIDVNHPSDGEGAPGPAGPPGAAGASGPAGVAGSAWLSGEGAPSTEQGNGGDFYLDAENGRIYGPKGSGNPGVWPAKYIQLAIPGEEEPPEPPEEEELKPPTFFSAASYWNKILPTSPPQQSNNGGLMATFKSKMAYYAGNPWVDTTTFSVPIYYVNNATTKRKITITQNTDPDLQAKFNSVPIPLDEGVPAAPAAGTDKHIAIVNTDTNEYWEGWVTSVSGNTYTMASGSYIEDITKSMGTAGVGASPTSKPFWGARASALAVVGGVMLIDEIEKGVIPHALAFSVPNPKNTFVFPAQRTDGGATGAYDIPEGTCYRLRKSYNVATSGKSKLAKMMMTAMQEYGMYLVDQAGVSVFYGEDPTPSGSTAWDTVTGGKYTDAILKEVPWDEFETVNVQKIFEGYEAEEKEKEVEAEVGSTPVFSKSSILSGSGSGSAKIPKPVGLTSGELELAFITVSGEGSAPTSVLIEGGGAWEKWGEFANEDNGFVKFRIVVYARIAGGAEPAEYTIKWTGAQLWREATILTFTNAAATTAAAKAGFAVQGLVYGTQARAPAMKPTVDNTLLLHFMTGSSGSGLSAPVGYIRVGSTSVGPFISARPLGKAAATGEPIGVWGENRELIAGILAIAPA